MQNQKKGGFGGRFILHYDSRIFAYNNSIITPKKSVYYGLLFEFVASNNQFLNAN